MNVMCSAVNVALPTVGEPAITGPLAAHVDSCAECWGEVAKYRAMYRELAMLSPTAYKAPRVFLDGVTDHLGPVVVAVEASEPRIDPRVPVAAAAVVATAAAGTAVLYKLYRDHAA